MLEYITLYDEIESTLCEHSAATLNQFRKAGRDTLAKKGFPSAKDEEYLYSKLSSEIDRDYGINVKRLKFPINPESIFKCAVPGINAHVVYMINDMMYNENKHEMNGAVFCSMRTACVEHAELVERYMSKSIAQTEDAFVALNHMFAQDGYFLYVPKGVKVELPIQIINIMRANMDSMATSRNLVILEENAEAKLLLCDHAIDKVSFFANRQTEVFIGENATLQYYSIESTHEQMCNLSGVYVEQSANSRLVYSTLGLENGTTRNHVEVNLNGEGANTTLGGMLVSDGKQRTDNHTVINHNAAHCTSTELYKYIMDDESEAIFSGLVVVKERAQHTVAQQTNRNISLTPTAHVWTKPQLVIYADDVKCGHGATTGQLDDSAMFYMQTRGISKSEARMLLLSAFATDVISLVEIESLRERLSKMIERRLRGDEAKCSGCTSC